MRVSRATGCISGTLGASPKHRGDSANSPSQRLNKGSVELSDSVDPLSLTAELRLSFEEELKDGEKKLEECWKNIRMEKYSDDQKQATKDRHAEEAREIARKKADRDRRLREAAKEARNPKRRVALELERRRENPISDEEKPHPIPMQLIQIPGPAGVKMISTVDVALLRARCLGIDCGAGGYETLKELSIEAEKSLRWEAEFLGSKKGRKNYVKINMAASKQRGPKLVSILDAPKGLRNATKLDEARRQQVQTYKRQFLDEKLVRHQQTSRTYTHMSNSDSESACSEEHYCGEYQNDDSRPQTSSQGVDKITAHMGLLALKDEDVLRELRGNNLLRRQASDQSATSRAGSGHTRRAAIYGSTNTDRRAEQRRANVQKWNETKLSSKRSSSVKDVAQSMQRRKTVAHLSVFGSMSRFKFAGYCLVLFFLVRKRHKAIDIIENFCKHLNESARMVAAMYKANRRVNQLQGVCRDFLQRKATWCAKAGKVWQEYEDQHLKTYFKLYKNQIMHETGNSDFLAKAAKEMSKRPRKSNMPARKSHAGDAEDEGVDHGRYEFPVLNWKAYRIPLVEKKFALGRWYSERLRGHVRMHKGWLETLRITIEQHKDFEIFLKSFGAENTSLSESSDMGTQIPAQLARPKDFLAFGEQDALELIAMCAQTLRSQKPFMEHPANKDLPVRGRGGKGWPTLRDAQGKRRTQISGLTQPGASGSDEGSGPASGNKPASASSGGLERCSTAGTGWLGRMGKTHRLSASGGSEPTREMVDRPLDVDELWKKFPVRLREISENSATNAAGTGAVGAVVATAGAGVSAAGAILDSPH